MNCCTSFNADTDRLFSRFAGLHRWRYRLTGLERTQRQLMVDRALGKTRRLCALTYPRDRRLTRMGQRIARWGLHRMGCCYQPYIHDPDRIAARIRDRGFRRVHAALTTAWLTEVYARTG